MLKASIKKNDKAAFTTIAVLSVVVFAVVATLHWIHIPMELPFNPHLFASMNAMINTMVSVILVAALIFVKQKKYELHKSLMMTCIVLSTIFLVTYILHHVFTGETHFGGEGPIKYVYTFILSTHIFLAAVILPFILVTAYRSLTGEFAAHKKIARITYPIWLYVSVTGVIVYLMISPYYQ
jgi:putative membrane protein